MRNYLLLFLAFTSVAGTSCRASDTDSRFARAERAFKRSGPMGVAAIYLTDARNGDARAAFYVATAYSIEAALRRKKGATDIAVRSLEDSAIDFYRRAKKGGDEEARIMLEQLRKHGRAALYFISIEHVFNEQDPRVTRPKRFYRPIKELSRSNNR